MSTRVAIGVRVATLLVVGPVAVAYVGPPATLHTVVPVVGFLFFWAVVFSAVALRRGLSGVLVAADAAVVAAATLLQPWLVPAEVLQDGSNWLLTLATSSVMIAQLGLRPLLGLSLAVFVAACLATGSLLAAPAGLGQAAAPGMLLLQASLIAWLMTLLRRAGRTAEEAMLASAARERQAAIDAARRADQREQIWQMHDHVLTTLLMVGTGSIDSASGALRAQAAQGLKVFQALGAPQAQTTGAVPLADCLNEVVSAAGAGLTVRVRVPDMDLPEELAASVASCVAEAVRNVARHAGVAAATVLARFEDGELVVEVTDRGRGFDPAAVPAHRRGVRESIVGRMSAAGGSAVVLSRPGLGTRVVLRCPA